MFVVHSTNYQGTDIECLANEIFFETSDYLNGTDLFQAFANLNSRFGHLLTNASSSYLLKIELTFNTQLNLLHYCQNFIYNFLTYCTIDSSFRCLQSIIIQKISPQRSLDLLLHLKSLPQLRSLTMNVGNDFYPYLTKIYYLILSLAYLKYNKLTGIQDFFHDIKNTYLLSTMNEQFNTIEYLNIDHRCTINDLLAILRHTPHLRHLICRSLIDLNTKIDSKHSVILSNLTNLFIKGHDSMFFHGFRRFMKKISHQLQILKLAIYKNEEYYDANQWKQFIQEYLPDLRQLYLIQADSQSEPHSASLNNFTQSFTSPFWVKNNGFLKLFLIVHIFVRTSKYSFSSV